MVDNAIKYGREGTDISIAIERVDRVPDTNRFGVAISIEDQGDGIPSEQLPRLTERFTGSTRRSRDMGGTGLGLAIVKHVVNRHQGKLSIRSGKDQVAFTVILPVVGMIRSHSPMCSISCHDFPPRPGPQSAMADGFDVRARALEKTFGSGSAHINYSRQKRFRICH